MNPVTTRKTLRYTHMAIAVMLALFIYSPTLREDALYAAVIQFGVFPFVALSGLAMWQQARLTRFIGIKR